jgi:hypothetical protein
LCRSSHIPTKVLTGQAELIVGEAGKAKRSGYSAPKHNSDGLAVTRVATALHLPIAICHS